MTAALDSSVIVVALDGDDSDQAACRSLLLSTKFSIHAHALVGTFSMLTGGRLAIRVPATDAAAMLRRWIAPRMILKPSERTSIRTKPQVPTGEPRDPSE